MSKQIFCFFLFASIGFAQTPQIDSMLLHNPDADTIFLYGKFGTVSGKVFLNDSSLQIFSWTDTLIAAKILPLFIGNQSSCGSITVTVAGIQSNSRSLEMGVISGAVYSTDTLDIHSSPFNVYWRYDFQSFFLNHSAKKISVPMSDGIAEFDFQNRKVYLHNGLVISLDSNYSLPSSGRYQNAILYKYRVIMYCNTPDDAKKSFQGWLGVNSGETLIPICNIFINDKLTIVHGTNLSCYDLLGRKQPIEFLGSDGTSSTYSLRSLRPGVYFVSDGKGMVKFMVGQ